MNIEAYELFRVLGVETRLKMLDLLKNESPIGTKELAERLGITKAAASQHLKILKQVGLVTNERQGYWIPYHINEQALHQCSAMFNQVCSCRGSHHHGGENRDIKSMNLGELQRMKERLQNKIRHIDALIEELKQ